MNDAIQDDILICDSAADQYCITKRAWYINECTNQSITCSRYISRESQKLEIVSEYSITYDERLLLTLIKINKGVLVEDNAEQNHCYILTK